MKRVVKVLCAVGLGFLLFGCASSPSMVDKPSGFLSNYKLLKPIQNPPDNMQVFVYQDPKVNRADYHAMIVAPVRLYQTATDDGITEQQIVKARNEIQTGIKQIVQRRIEVTDQPGPGVARLEVAITGAEVEDASLKPRNFIPVSAALLLVSKATGLEQKHPVMVVELKITDSTTGQLLKEVLTSIKGDDFRDTADIKPEFSRLATTWVQKALQYSSAKAAQTN